jgi:cbb3-type cytochrome oxidase subunit 3
MGLAAAFLLAGIAILVLLIILLIGVAFWLFVEAEKESVHQEWRNKIKKIDRFLG